MNTTRQVIEKIEALIARYTEYQPSLNRPLHEIVGTTTVHDLCNSIILEKFKDMANTLKAYEIYHMNIEVFLNSRLKEFDDDKNDIVAKVSSGTPLSMYDQARLMAIHEFNTTLSLKDIFYED